MPYYFLNIKKTAKIKKKNEMMWFSLKVSVLKTNSVKPAKTTNVMTSWITFNWIRENGPPFPLKPILLAGTWNIYSKSAIPQLINIIEANPNLLSHFSSENFKCPYQAIIINELLKIKRITVIMLFITKFIVFWHSIHLPINQQQYSPKWLK